MYYNMYMYTCMFLHILQYLLSLNRDSSYSCLKTLFRKVPERTDNLKPQGKCDYFNKEDALFLKRKGG